MAYGRSFEALKEYYLAHILRGIFGLAQPIRAVSYSGNSTMMDTLHSSEFGVETWTLFTGDFTGNESHCHSWDIGRASNASYFGNDFCDLFVTYDYGPYFGFTYTQYDNALDNIYNLMKKNGVAVFINSSLVKPNDDFDRSYYCGFWRDKRKEEELKSFGVLFNNEIVVLRK